MAEQILILDFGSQYTQLIARRVRELNVYCEIHPFNNPPEINDNIKGVIYSGGPCSVLDDGSLVDHRELLKKYIAYRVVCEAPRGDLHYFTQDELDELAKIIEEIDLKITLQT